MFNFPKAPDWVIFDEDLAEQGHKQWPYLDTVLAIEYYKVLSAFRVLCEDDKMALAKGTIFQIAMFHGAYDSFRRGHCDTVVQPDGYRNLSHPYFQHDSLALTAREGVLPYLRELDIHDEHFVLLKAIIALNPLAPDLSPEGRELISQEREKHQQLLMSLIQTEDSKTWLSRFVRLFDLVNGNLRAAEAMQHLFFLKYLPLISVKVKVSALWIELFMESCFS
uniref:NR LBD domain-containing protein n=1 Tax=Steinernema glaseri TaxID=37863 RepID=A0A1I7ZQR7_9BILA